MFERKKKDIINFNFEAIRFAVCFWFYFNEQLVIILANIFFLVFKNEELTLPFASFPLVSNVRIYQRSYECPHLTFDIDVQTTILDYRTKTKTKNLF